MDRFFNNAQISAFLSHYAIECWPSIIESFALFAIRSLWLHHPEGTYPDTKDLVEFFSRRDEDCLVEVYVELHRLDKKMRQLVKHRLPEKGRPHSKGHSKSRRQSKTKENQNNVFSTSFDTNKKPQAKMIIKSSLPKNSGYAGTQKEQSERKCRPQTEMGEYREKSTRSKNRAETGKRVVSKENVASDAHSPRNRKMSRNCSALHENEYNCVKPATATSSTRNKNFPSKQKSRETLSRRDSIHSFNEKCELWAPENSGMEKLISAHKVDACERLNFYSDAAGREPIKVFNKFTTLLNDHKFKHNYHGQLEEGNSPLLTSHAKPL
eukprot:TRINITY_DN8794_c0_g3_i1.p1 TRINITY_DN8794_c0_g3~~TRINITY_DN8794_c0_g3_i1.p1  ORF type:complete len:324 (-),score=80.58 TRINITY_DN8794_c0_g3_i1:30-1001(-)